MKPLLLLLLLSSTAYAGMSPYTDVLDYDKAMATVSHITTEREARDFAHRHKGNIDIAQALILAVGMNEVEMKRQEINSRRFKVLKRQNRVYKIAYNIIMDKAMGAEVVAYSCPTRICK